MSITTSVSIIIPTYNEARRLPSLFGSLEAFIGSHPEVEEIVIVDDGSSDETLRIVRHQTPERIPLKLVSYFPNAGKGYAIRRGILESTSSVVLISDADLSTPLEEIETLAPYLERFDIVIGSRAIDPSKVRKRQPWYRQRMGKTFNLLMRRITSLPFRDTQCGFKLFRGPVAREIFRDGIVDRFAFDVEILVLALHRGYSVCEVPVLWFNAEGSRVSIVRDSVRMLLDTIRVRLRLGAPPTGSAVLADRPATPDRDDQTEHER